MEVIYKHEDIVKILNDIQKGTSSYLCELTECKQLNCLETVRRWFNNQDYEAIENYLAHLTLGQENI